MSDNLEKMSENVIDSVNIYSVYDRVAGRTVCTFQAENDGLAVRDNAPALSKVCPIGDLELYHVGSLDVKGRFFRCFDTWKKVDWNSYKFPENPFVKKDN